MDILQYIFDFLRPGIPMVAALVLGFLILIGTRKFLEKRFEGQPDRSMKVQLLILLLSFILLVVVIIVSPVSDNQKGQILSLIGIVLSAAIALSSTTFIGNAVAGLMMRAVQGFRVGDFIRVGDHFGRVSERGLFHVEIQTEERDLTTIPNLHLVTNPVKVVRYSGTVVWTEVSLGYDIPRVRIKEAMLQAANNCELNEPFVHVMSLGDFSIVYRVSGLLTEVKQLLSTRSRLKESVLDELHAAGIEIVSPTYMNTRQLSADTKILSKVVRERVENDEQSSPEEIVFDKAEEAESLEQLRERFLARSEEIKTIEKSLKDTEDEKEQSKLEHQLKRLEQSRDALAARLESAQEE